MEDTAKFKVSIIINNWNYAEFVSAAIESALSIDWADKEVIVVDDGSTDDSLSRIHQYESKIRLIAQANGGQRTAYNAGFAACSGDLVIFLDSDDLLDRDLIREIARIITPTTSKIQCQLRVIDAEGRPTGGIIPTFPKLPTPEDIRTWMFASSTYPCPPGSGNAYSRSYLAHIFPLTDCCGDAGDSYTIAAAPVLGDVLTLDRPLGSYRVHGRNDGAMAQLKLTQFAAETKRGIQRVCYSQMFMSDEMRSAVALNVNRGLRHLTYRVSSYRLTPREHPVPGDNSFKILADATRALTRPQGLAKRDMLLLYVFILLVSMAPVVAVRVLVTWRFVPSARPKWIRLAMDRVRGETAVQDVIGPQPFGRSEQGG